MTTLSNLADLSSAHPLHAPDFVSTDTAALASHMSHCASTRSRFFGLHAVLESAHSLIFPRMVTVAVIAVIAVALLGMAGTV
ncbi:MAG: hypothetical protein V4455_07460 [Pseudomonadota bacterium]